MADKRLRVMDTTIRDGQQSLWATRMTIGDILPILPKMDEVGYWAIEAWGGATFDSCLRFLDENPWDRLRQIKAATPKTPLAMLVRGQNLVGYRHYPPMSSTASLPVRTRTASMSSVSSML